ncbi:unnamed protein product [Agarophyton chilense]|eukprot:gb/GEZJ01000763.1/.p2 GENE.gb/GEZJ01000763.1/~~gb/GEZJ01000763.1/.p2  ORF type:complete len:167 (-),score=18.50 gb/GEZJ01000763.1/:2178-2678(-)
MADTDAPTTEAEKVAAANSLIKYTSEEEATLAAAAKVIKSNNPPAAQKVSSASFIPSDGHIWVDGMKVLITTSSGTSGTIQFRLRYPKDAWWKGVWIQDSYQRELGSIESSGEGPVYSEKFPRNRFESRVYLDWWKAKFLGVHTWVFCGWMDANEVDGKIVDIYFP